MSAKTITTTDHAGVLPCLRIALVTWSMPGGGVEIYLLRLGRFLVSRGHDVEIITTESPGNWFPRIAEQGIKATHLTGFEERKSSPFRHAVKVACYLKEGKYDFVFVNGSQSAQALLTRLPDRTIAIPVLHIDHDDYYGCYLTNRRAWNLAIGVSPRVRNVAAARVPDRPVRYLANGVVMPTDAQWQARQPWATPLQVLFVGRIADPHKGIDFIPEIIKGCVERGVDMRFTVIGDGVDLNKLQGKISEYGLDGITQFCGFLPADEVYAYLLRSHVFLLTSRYEGLPTVVLEASGCGCVTVGSLLPGITDVAVENGESGLLAEVGHIDGFVQAIERLYREPDTWRRMSQAAHETAVREFSVEAMGERYLAVMADALAGRYPLPRSRRWQFPLDLAAFKLDLEYEVRFQMARQRLFNHIKYNIVLRSWNWLKYVAILPNWNWLRYEVFQRYWNGIRNKILMRGWMFLRSRLLRK